MATAPTVVLSAQALRTAVVVQLAAKIPTATVRHALARPFADSEVLPTGALNVFCSGGSASNRAGANGLPVWEHRETVNIVGALTLADGAAATVSQRLADALDVFSDAIMTAIFESPKLARLGWRSYSEAKGVGPEGGAYRGEVRLAFVVAYERRWSLDLDEVNVDDLDAVDIRFDLNGDGAHGPDAEEETGPDSEPRLLVDGLASL